MEIIYSYQSPTNCEHQELWSWVRSHLINNNIIHRQFLMPVICWQWIRMNGLHCTQSFVRRFLPEAKTAADSVRDSTQSHTTANQMPHQHSSLYIVGQQNKKPLAISMTTYGCGAWRRRIWTFLFCIFGCILLARYVREFPALFRFLHFHHRLSVVIRLKIQMITNS